MFEQFTKRARHVVVLSQEAARDLNHNYIGTEHLLLGLLGEPAGIAGRALDQVGVTRSAVQDEVIHQIGRGGRAPSGHLPFTPRAKKVLELGLREALRLSHNYIGTEHLLLGIVTEGRGVAAQILTAQAGDLMKVRMAVLDLLPATPPGDRLPWPPRPQATPGDDGQDEPGAEGEQRVRATPAAQLSLDQAARLAGPQPVGSHHLVLGTLADPGSAAARALAGLGVDLERARQALRDADVTGTSDERPHEAGGRQMLIRVGADRITLEATDQEILQTAWSARDNLGDRADGGIIRGDLPGCESLGGVWQALRDSLDDIRRRAATPPGQSA